MELRTRRRGGKVCFVFAAAVVTAPAFAQYPPPGSVAPPGSIIVTRDVPQRPAFDPGQPGTVNAVQASPLDIIFGATGQTVSILSDNETADVAAGVQAQRGALGAGLTGADAGINQQFANNPGHVAAGSLGGGLGNSISNAVGNATGAIGKALAPLSSGGGGK